MRMATAGKMLFKIKSELVVSQSSLQLLQLAYLAKSMQTIMELNL